MAEKKGVNATKREQSLPDLEGQGETNAPLKVAFDTYELSAAFAQGDTITMMKLPPLARVHDVVLLNDVLDTAGGDIDVGWEANGVDAADTDGFLNGVDATLAGVSSMADDQPTVPGMFKQFGNAETQVIVTATAAGGWDQTSGTVSVAVYYTVS